MTLKGHGKFLEKVTTGFQFSPGKNSVNFVPASQTVKISYLMGLVFLKGTFRMQKLVAGISSDYTEGSWQIQRKTDS